ncbi:hypothetical protein [uncultured Marinobacter sp.]|uniref:hypothetical protein n=1 Tax=uncultured Marinobacter sp. TaxID=187379 RepID=UPI00259731EE|nr:hypothetical protein [uncultured Marinobacter sp.]
MPWKTGPEIWDIVGALIVSIVSAAVSITRRIVNGYPASMLWVVSEFLAAILAGYLMYSVYPHIVDDIPKWFTLPVAVAFSAHVGGRLFQEMENELVNRYTNLFDRRR